MKHLLLALPLGLLAVPVLGQQIEYSVRGGATFAQYHGNTAVGSTNVQDANGVPGAESSRAVNPYGQHLGVGGSLGLRVTRQEKFKLLTAFDLGYELLQTRADINNINYNSTVVAYSRRGTGVVRLYTQAVTAFAGVGYRLGGGEHKLALDAMVGPELAYLTTARESAKGNATDYNTSYSSDLVRTPDNRLGFRLRGELTLWVKKLGVVGSYSYGFTNHMPSSSATPNPDAALAVLRAGLAYRFK